MTASKMNWEQIKTMLKGCSYAIWQAGADTNVETSALKAHKELRTLIYYDEPCDVARATRIGNTLYIVEQSRHEYIEDHA